MPVSIWMAAPPAQPERRQNTSHSASSLRSPITGLAVDLGEGVAGVLEEAVEHIDARRDGSGGAGGAGFIEGGDEERLAAGAGERARDRVEPAAIGVGLDHAGAFGRHRGLLELAPVGDDGVEIDGEHAGGGGGGGGQRRAPRWPRGTACCRRQSISDRKRCSCRDFTRRGARRFNRAGGAQ